MVERVREQKTERVGEVVEGHAGDVEVQLARPEHRVGAFGNQRVAEDLALLLLHQLLEACDADLALHSLLVKRLLKLKPHRDVQKHHCIAAELLV